MWTDFQSDKTLTLYDKVSFTVAIDNTYFILYHLLIVPWSLHIRYINTWCTYYCSGHIIRVNNPSNLSPNYFKHQVIFQELPSKTSGRYGNACIPSQIYQHAYDCKPSHLNIPKKGNSTEVSSKYCFVVLIQRKSTFICIILRFKTCIIWSRIYRGLD